MGFRLNRTYVLNFADTALDGLEVKIRSTPVAVWVRLRSATDEELAELLAEYMTSWNYEDTSGKPVPIAQDAIMAELEMPVLARICTEWYKACAGVTAPLDGPSTSGEPSPGVSPETSMEQSLPMQATE